MAKLQHLIMAKYEQYEKRGSSREDCQLIVNEGGFGAWIRRAVMQQ